MFDVSLIELAVIALVALLVLGPEKLPRAARTVGLYVRKARQSWYSVRADIERELAADELKRSMKQTEQSIRNTARLAAPVPEAQRDPLARDEPRAAPVGEASRHPLTRDEPPAA
jgi:sec-independent protein translocase protein TatB